MPYDLTFENLYFQCSVPINLRGPIFGPLKPGFKAPCTFNGTSWPRPFKKQTSSKLNARQLFGLTLTGQFLDVPKVKSRAVLQVRTVDRVVCTTTLDVEHTTPGSFDSHLGWSVVGISSMSRSRVLVRCHVTHVLNQS